VPDYMHPALGPDKLKIGSPAKLTLWFESFEEAQAFATFLREQELERLTDGITEENRHPES